MSISLSDYKEKLYECIICTETVPNLITCRACKKSCCDTCFERYILDSGLIFKCMHCSKKLLFEDIIEMSNKKWYNDIFRPNRRKLLLIEQKSLFESTKEQAKIYSEAKTLNRQPEVIKHLIETICSKSNGCTSPGWCGGCCGYSDIDDEYREELEILDNKTIMANRCVEDYGRGWEKFNFETLEFEGVLNENNKAKDTYNLNIFPCPILSCIGYVKDNVCNLCNKTMCGLCKEEYQKGHKCNSDTVKSIEIINTYCRSCPKCYVKIYKIEGCDQLFCTECKTTFSWATSRIINDFEYEPIYTEWVSRVDKSIIGLRKDNYNCNEYITTKQLMSLFSSNAQKDYKKCKNLINLEDIFEPLELEEQYLAVFLRLHENILKVRATAGNHANIRPFYAQELRVQLLVGEIIKNDFLKMLEENDFNYNKSMMYYNIYKLVYTSATILFDNLVVFRTTIKKKEREEYKINNKSWMEFLFETHCQLQKILEYANNRLDYMKSIFGNDNKFAKFHR
jgi:hypothetical protein